MISNPSCKPPWNSKEREKSRANPSIHGTFFSLFPERSTSSAVRVASRLRQAQIGFGAKPREILEDSDLLRQAETRDFVDYGMEPEFIGRLPVRVVCDPLTSSDLFEILKRSEGSIIRQYERSFRAYGVEVFFEDEALREIAARAAEEATGARGLLTVCERIFRDFKFELPGSGVASFTVTPGLIAHPAEALAELLHAGHAEREKAQRGIVAEFSEGSQASTESKFPSRATPLSAFLARAAEENLGVREFCERSFKDYQFGLTLIKRNNGRIEFSIPARAVEIQTVSSANGLLPLIATHLRLIPQRSGPVETNS